MANPAYITDQHVHYSDVTEPAALLLTTGSINWLFPYTTVLDETTKTDLDKLVAANGGSLPLANESVARDLRLANGSTWWDTYNSATVRVDPAKLPAQSSGGGGTPSGGLTNAELRASPVPVSGTVAVSGTLPVSGPLTDTQLRATAVPVSLSGTTAVSGPLTNTELRAAAVPVSGPATDAQLRATPLPVSGTVAVSGTVPISGALTDTQIRATPLPVSGTVGVSGTVPVSGPATDAQLRATPLPVSGTVAITAAALPLPSGAATSALQTTGNTSLASIVTALGGLLRVNTLAQPGVSRSIATSTTSASVQLTTGVTRISIVALGSAARYRLTAATSTAVATDHYIGVGERLDLAVPSGWFINVLATSVGSLEVTELT